MTDGREPRIVSIYPRVLTRNHNFPSARIIDLIKSSLDPLLGDPIPTTIIIHNIVITQTNPDNLSIECEVIYAV